MAFDIFVDSCNDPDKYIRVYSEEFYFIVEKIEGRNDFPILKKILSDFYGDDEVYPDQLENLKNELINFDKYFREFYDEHVKKIFDQLFGLIDYAIKNREPIRLAGD